MTSKKTLAIIVIILLLLFFALWWFLFRGRGSDDVSNLGSQPQATVTGQNPSIEIITNPSTPEVKVGRTETISIDLPNSNSRKPTAIDLTFRFDPVLVEVVNIVPGRIWNSANVLKKEINNDAGIVRIAAGQGFNAQTTNNLDLVEIEYRVLTEGDIVFQMTSASKFAFVGDKDVTYVKSSNVVIKATN
jgi:hypothetical protein